MGTLTRIQPLVSHSHLNNTTMKITLVFLGLIAVALAVKTCHDGKDCVCHHDGETANCENHVCTCVSNGAKRAEHTCMSDADCGTYDCHGHGNATCVTHGSAEHGHMLCACIH